MPVLYTIGFTQRSARDFFTTLQKNSIQTLIDIRINNTSQLAGFTKKDDLEYFLQELLSIRYIHDTMLAPTKELLKKVHKKEISFEDYAKEFMLLLQKRQVEKNYTIEKLNNACLLCSEHSPQHCHRSLVARYFQSFFDIQVRHL